MSANRAKDTGPELTLRKALWHAGLRGYRLHRRIILDSPPYQGGVSAPRRRGGSPSVRPDIAFIGKKLAIFVHGCFWHRCPKCTPHLPNTNSEFWQAKFARNVARDESKQQALEAQGWTVIIVWECELERDLKNTLNTILSYHG